MRATNTEYKLALLEAVGRASEAPGPGALTVEEAQLTARGLYLRFSDGKVKLVRLEGARWPS